MMNTEEQKPYTEFAKDSRQRKLLRKVIREHCLPKEAYFLKSKLPQDQLDEMWMRLTSEGRREAYLLFLERDRAEAPPYREIGMRLRQIRKDRKLSLQEFSNMIYSPVGKPPLPRRELKYTETQLRDFEYGRRPFAGTTLPIMVFNTFGVSETWLLRGYGTPPYESPVSTRIDVLEKRVNDLENSTAENLGANHLMLLEEQNHSRVIKEGDGRRKLVSGTNTQLRLELDEANQKLKNLEKNLLDQNKLWELSMELIKNIEGCVAWGGHGFRQGKGK